MRLVQLKVHILVDENTSAARVRTKLILHTYDIFNAITTQLTKEEIVPDNYRFTEKELKELT